MSDRFYARRTFLRSVAGMVVGGAFVSNTAEAITPLSSSDYAGMLEGACGPTGDHAGLIAETEAALGRPRTDPIVQAVLQRMTCPICGCPLAAAPVAGQQTPF